MFVEELVIQVIEFFFCRFDIVQRLQDYSFKWNLHLMATREETILQFYIARNNQGQVSAPIADAVTVIHRVK